MEGGIGRLIVPYPFLVAIVHVVSFVLLGLHAIVHNVRLSPLICEQPKVRFILSLFLLDEIVSSKIPDLKPFSATDMNFY